MRILIIEDQMEIAEGISTILKTEGYETDIVCDGQSGLDGVFSGIYDLVLLDIMLPKRNGLDILKIIRKNRIFIPVIVLTARSQTDDKIIGLDCGADDYLTKPFDAGELLARIRARLRRLNHPVSDGTFFADIRLEQSTYKLYGKERSVKLARKEYQLLEYLMLNHGQILPRDMLISKIWGYCEETEYNQLDVYISFVRKKLKFVESQAIIVTTKGIGYSLEES